MKVYNIFYGCGRDGYAVLGSSVADKTLVSTAERLCRALGTQGYTSPEDDVPFLFQKVLGDTVLMGCGRTGEKDASGRGTLFFHIIAVSLAEVKASGVSALDAYRDGLFKEKTPPGEIKDVVVEFSSSPQHAAAGNLALPAVISCRRANNLRIAELLGERAVATDWTTFSWCVPDGFTSFGVDCSCRYLTVDSGMNLYFLAGEELCEIPWVGEREKVLESATDVPDDDADATDRCRRFLSVKHSAAAAAVCLACLLVGCVLGWVGAAMRNPRQRNALMPVFDEHYRLEDSHG